MYACSGKRVAMLCIQVNNDKALCWAHASVSGDALYGTTAHVYACFTRMDGSRYSFVCFSVSYLNNDCELSISSMCWARCAGIENCSIGG